MPTEPPRRGNPAARGLGSFLNRRAKALSLVMAVAVVAPVVVVAAQIVPRENPLPMSEDFRMWDARTLDWIWVSDHRDRVVLLDFMATWCESCRASMADLLAVHEAYAGLAFTILSVTTDPRDTLGMMEAYRKEYSANWTFAVPLDPPQVGRTYNVSSYPTIVLLDRDGRMTYRAVGHIPLETLRSHIDRTLGP